MPPSIGAAAALRATFRPVLSAAAAAWQVRVCGHANTSPSPPPPLPPTLTLFCPAPTFHARTRLRRARFKELGHERKFGGFHYKVKALFSNQWRQTLLSYGIFGYDEVAYIWSWVGEFVSSSFAAKLEFHSKKKDKLWNHFSPYDVLSKPKMPYFHHVINTFINVTSLNI